MRLHILALLLLSPAATASGSGVMLGDVAPKTLETCDALVRDHPDDPEAHRCFFVVGVNYGLAAEAGSRYEALLQNRPENHWARYWLARLEWSNHRMDGVEEGLRRAMAGFDRDETVQGRVWARESLAVLLQNRDGDLEEARDLLVEALAIAEEAGDPVRAADVRLEMAGVDRRRQDYRTAWSLLADAESAFSREEHLGELVRVVMEQAALAWDIGRLGDARRFYRRALDLLGDRGPFLRARILRNLSALAGNPLGRGLMTSEEEENLARQAVALAVETGNRAAEIGARITLSVHLDGEQAIQELERALALALETGHLDACWALWRMAEEIQQLDLGRHPAALALADEAVALARSRGDRYHEARGLLVRAALVRNALHAGRPGSHEDAVADSLAALDAVERIRDLQVDREVRARIFSRFARSYRIFAGWAVTTPGGGSSEERVELALRASERLRARELLETLDASGHSASLAGSGPTASERAEVLAEMTAVQRQLVDPVLTAGPRQELLRRLERLEGEEALLREKLAREDPAFASLRRPRLPGLAELQAALRPDEVLLLWVGAVERETRLDYGTYLALVISSSDTRAAPTDALMDIADEIAFYQSLLERRDGSGRDGARRLGEKLLGEIADLLPGGTRRLIIVPDLDLHRLSFASLLLPGSEEALGARYEISLVPSAATWLRWRKGEIRRAPEKVVALADPAFPFDEGRAIFREAGLFEDPLRLGRLPHAREEARSLARRLGGGEILTGEAATEWAFKRLPVTSFRVLHLATHALVDEERPERSAIVLAPGAESEDGLLQYREILELELDGQLVLLSACRSASGAVIGGEGATGLAQAFFHAGARTVVAGLWPLRDDEVAELVDEFGRRLGRGASVGSALHGARRTLLDRGRQAAAWAGLVVLGDGELVPFPEGKESRVPKLPWAIGLVLLVGAALTALLLLRRRAS